MPENQGDEIHFDESFSHQLEKFTRPSSIGNAGIVRLVTLFWVRTLNLVVMCVCFSGACHFICCLRRKCLVGEDPNLESREWLKKDNLSIWSICLVPYFGETKLILDVYNWFWYVWFLCNIFNFVCGIYSTWS